MPRTFLCILEGEPLAKPIYLVKLAKGQEIDLVCRAFKVHLLSSRPSARALYTRTELDFLSSVRLAGNLENPCEMVSPLRRLLRIRPSQQPPAYRLLV
jgi:hypothetical protein